MNEREALRSPVWRAPWELREIEDGFVAVDKSATCAGGHCGGRPPAPLFNWRGTDLTASG
jgi:hypothetical protein